MERMRREGEGGDDEEIKGDNEKEKTNRRKTGEKQKKMVDAPAHEFLRRQRIFDYKYAQTGLEHGPDHLKDGVNKWEEKIG